MKYIIYSFAINILTTIVGIISNLVLIMEYITYSFHINIVTTAVAIVILNMVPPNITYLQNVFKRVFGKIVQGIVHGCMTSKLVSEPSMQWLIPKIYVK